ncbi:MAG: sigma-70 region 4 domain-containing protein [Oscillospiraceae bacterium]|jgi:hypothetical protein|nr:sigma-70 region 4 domain-containing protein [Oscillospiraceae bacterium]
MPRGRTWTNDELEYLREKWGKFNIPQLAARLGRFENAIRIKIVRLGLGKGADNYNCLTARKTSELLGVDIHTVTDFWIAKKGLKAKRRAPHGTRKQWWIDFDALRKWLKNNSELWDSRRVELFALGGEPDWLKAKRESDAAKHGRKAQKWTSSEDLHAILLYRSNCYTVAQIAERLDRSASAVEHRLARLDIFGTGEYIGDRSDRLREKRFGAFWQKDMCRHWDAKKGCAEGGVDCDKCQNFARRTEE